MKEHVEEILQEEKRLGLLVSAVKKESNLLAYEIKDNANTLVIDNLQLMDLFNRKSRMITNIAIF